LFFYGGADNNAAPLYVAIEDSAGHVAVVTHPDPDAVQAVEWQTWRISFDEISAAGVNLVAVETLYLGLGDRTNPAAGGAGLINVDAIGYGTPLRDVAAGAVE